MAVGRQMAAAERRSVLSSSASSEFADLRKSMRVGNEAASMATLSSWLNDQQRDMDSMPLTGAEHALLLEDAVHAGYRPELLGYLITLLDGAVDLSARGQHPLDVALQVAVEENPDENVALLLLEERLALTGENLPKLNATPLLRIAAAKCFPRVAEQLVFRGGASVNAPDPRFGATALDRAVTSACSKTVKVLLELGADPNQGRGIAYLLERASPDV